MTEEELQSSLHELEEERFTLRFQRKTQELASPIRLRLVRRDIARVKTVLRDQERRKEE